MILLALGIGGFFYYRLYKKKKGEVDSVKIKEGTITEPEDDINPKIALVDLEESQRIQLKMEDSETPKFFDGSN